MRAEMTKGGGRDPARMKKMLERFDKDGDGKLGENERAAMRAEMQKRREAGGLKGKGGEKRAEMLKKFDKDGDGTLNEDEQAAMREALKEQRGKNAKPKKAE
jgi:Ca2+-binding EF-hand superfamily protein